MQRPSLVFIGAGTHAVPMSPRHSLLAVAVMVVWGCNFVVVDAGLADVPPLLLVAIRFTLVALPLVFFVPRPRGTVRDVVAIGLFMSLGQFTLLYLALALGLPSGLAALLLQAQVVFTIAIATLVLRATPTRRQVLGAGVGTAGLAAVAVAHGLSAPALPLVVVLAAALSWAVGNVVSRRSGIAGGLSTVVWSALVVPLPALGASLLLDGPDEVVLALTHLSPTAVASTAYTVIASSLLGYTVWNSLLARYPVAAVTPFVLLVPPIGITAGWLFQGEVPTAPELVGAGVVLLGVAIATVRARPRSRPQQIGAGQVARPATAERS